MQNVSQYYLDAVERPSRHWEFKIYVKRKKEYATLCTLVSGDIKENTIKVNRIALKDNYMGISGAGSSKLEFQLTASGILKMEAVNRLCKTTFLDFWVWLKTEDPSQSDDDITENTDHTENTSGRVHIGEFHITDVKSTAFDCSVTAYDAMVAFNRYVRAAERKLLNRGEHSYAYLLDAFCTRCSKGVYNIVLDDQIDFSELPNGTLALGVDKDIKFENYRDIIIYMAQLLGCFAYVTRDGKLSFKKFSQDIDYELGAGSVFQHEFGGVYYEVYGIEMNVAGFDCESTNPTQEPDNPANFKLDENPFLRHLEPDDDGTRTGVTQQTEDAINNIADAVRGLKFNGGTCQGVYHPELDLGDRLRVTVKTLYNHQTVQNVVYPYVLLGEITETYITRMDIKSPDYTGDIDAAVKSSNFKGEAGGGGGGGGSSTPLASVVHIQGKSDKAITTIESALFASASTSIRAEANMPVLVWFTGTFVAETNAHLTLSYEYDGIATFSPLEYNLQEGRNTVTFSVGFDATETELIHHFGLFAKVNSGTVGLAKKDFQLNVYSSGATSSEPTWSGTYIVNDVVDNLEMSLTGAMFNDLDDNLEEVTVEFDV